MLDLTNKIQPDTSTAVALLQLQQHRHIQPLHNGSILSPSSYQGSDIQPSHIGGSPLSMPSSREAGELQQDYQFSKPSNGTEGVSQPQPRSTPNSHSGAKRKRGDFEIRKEVPMDIVSNGLITFDAAVLYFGTFFQGCVGASLQNVNRGARLI
jgi:hypothetical protein